MKDNQGKKHYVHVERKNHLRAKAICKSMNGKLAEPKSESDYKNLIYLAKLSNVQVFWIGITDIVQEGHFTYESDGNEIVWEDWDLGEPNNGRIGTFWFWKWSNEDCVESVLIEGRGRWTDQSCDVHRSFICEM